MQLEQEHAALHQEQAWHAAQENKEGRSAAQTAKHRIWRHNPRKSGTRSGPLGPIARTAGSSCHPHRITAISSEGTAERTTG